MFELFNDLLVRSDDEEYDDGVEVYDEREDGEESFAATNITEAEERGNGAASAASATDTSTAFAVVVVKAEPEAIDASNDGDGQTDNKQSNSSGNEHAIGDRYDDDDDEENDNVGEENEWNGLFEEFKTGIFSLKSSVSAVSAVAADVFTGAIEEAHASMTTSLIMSAGAGGRPLFVLSAADEDEDEYFEDEGDETIMNFMDSGIGDDNNEEEDIDQNENEDEEIIFLEPARISNEDHEHEPRWLSTPITLESLDVVKVRQRLMRAEEQRNTLMQMVEGRNEDICKLRFDLDQQKLQRLLRRQSEHDQIHWLKREVEWWKLLISSNTNDSVRSGASVKALSAIISQMREDLRPNVNNCSVGDSINASEEVIRDLQLRIQTIKENKK
jgi:hypothetical protein